MSAAQILFAALCTICLYRDSSKQVGFNDVAAFMFHQASSISQPTTLYPNQNESSSNFNSYNNLLKLRGIQNNQRSPETDRSQISSSNYFTPRSAATSRQDDSDTCPSECQCNRQAQIVDCSNRNLIEIPKGFPRDTKRIRLERNNITELGPYAFQGLKRLQRIDLSNNNLARIDPLAFAGGLQSLNSLILYSNKLNQLPVNLFSELSQLQLLLLNANSLQCIQKELFHSLTSLNLLSLYDNGIETLANGTFDGLKNIKTIHLGKNPLICDCNLRWLADYLEANPGAETSEARCEAPTRNQAKKISQLGRHKFRCEANEQSRSAQIVGQCNPSPGADSTQPTAAPAIAGQQDQSCPVGCECKGSTVDCSRASKPTESRPTGSNGAPNDIFELPDIPDDIPVHIIRMHINDTRIKRIRQTGLFRRLANAQKLDLGNNRIVDIEDNAINGGGKPERVVFVLLENDQCDPAGRPGDSNQSSQAGIRSEDACALAPRVVADSPCYNGGSCMSSSTLTGGLGSNRASGYLQHQASNYSCLCPPGFMGSLCEINIDDCLDHQCQNGAMCVDGVNSYKCVCRDPTTSGEFCEQLSSYATSSANSIAPMALPIVASPRVNQISAGGSSLEQKPRHQQQQQQQILARSANLLRPPVELSQTSKERNCKRVTQKKYYEDGNGCQSVRLLKLSVCVGSCEAPRNFAEKGDPLPPTAQSGAGCCLPAKIKRKRVRMQCSDGASYVKTVDLVKKCSCSSDCLSGADSSQTGGATDGWNDNQQQQNYLSSTMYNATQEDQLMQITRLDAVD